MRKIIKSIIASVATTVLVVASSSVYSAEWIDNSGLIPDWVPDSEVTTEGTHPDWLKTLIMMQFRIETVSDTHDFKGAVKALDHCAELGVNGVWINPVYQKSEANRLSSNNGYGIYRYDQIDSVMTGTTDKEESFRVAKDFVDEAHKRNIRVFFDIVVWGVDKDSPHLTENPEWFMYNGDMREGWGGYLFNWSNQSWREWYINNAVQIALKTGIDGFRCDLEPSVTGYNLWGEVRRRLWEEHDRKFAIISEGTNTRAYGVYDFEQVGVGEEPGEPMKWDAENYFMENNIVDSILTGKGIGTKDMQLTGHSGEARYYTMNLLTHDSKAPRVRRNKVRIGYQAILAPFIPFWNIGEEWNNPRVMLPNGTGVMYFNTIQWDKIDEPANREFFEAVKKMIRIRRTYTEIFEYYPENHKETNICKVHTDGGGLQAYARFAEGRGVLVVPNIEDTKKITVTMPYAEMGIAGAQGYKITDLMTDKVVLTDTADKLNTITVEIEREDQRILLVEATGTIPTQPAPTATPQAATITPGADSISEDEISDISISSSDGSVHSGSGSEINTDDEKEQMSDDMRLIFFALAVVILIGAGFGIFYYLLKKGKIFRT